jgi:branched-subunit amino acid ABC-type transport system permease component
LSSFTVELGFGLVAAGFIAVAAVGATLQFGITNYINFALGDYMTVGAYGAWALTSRGINFWVATAVSVVLGALVALVISRLVLAPFVRRKTPILYMLIVTLGVGLVISNLIQLLAGPNQQQYPESVITQPALQLGPFLATPNQLITIGLAAALMIAVHFMLTRTALGKRMRAMSDDPDLARVAGIDAGRITDWVWIISGGLAALSGVLLALDVGSFTPSFGELFLFVVFAAVVVGGAGQPNGAMLGALITGLATSLSVLVVDSAYKNDVAFLILLAALVLRPRGLIPSRRRSI